MKAYEITSEKFFLEIEKNVYFVWNVNSHNTFIIDQFIKVENQLKFVKIIANKKNNTVPTTENIKEINTHYQNRENYKTFNPKQLLTHGVPEIRDFIKELIDESISKYNR